MLVLMSCDSIVFTLFHFTVASLEHIKHRYRSEENITLTHSENVLVSVSSPRVLEHLTCVFVSGITRTEKLHLTIKDGKCNGA